MTTRDAVDGGYDAVARMDDASTTGSWMPGERARTNLALLYGGAASRPSCRVLIDPTDRCRAAIDGGRGRD